MNPENEGFITVNETKDEIFGFKADKLIGINSDRTLGWVHFIMTRELGRYALKYKDEKTKGLYAYKDNDNRHDVRKDKIDLFNANLLTPSKNFKETYNETKRLYDDNEEKMNKALSKCFMATLELVKIKIRDLKLA